MTETTIENERVSGVMMHYNKIDKCRICLKSELQLIFNFGMMSSCGYFLSSKPNAIIPAAPLCLVRCNDCGLVQLQHNYDMDNLFGKTA